MNRLLAGLGGPALTDHATHLAVHGDLPRLDRHRLHAELRTSGLRGRGGAAYPFAAKLDSLPRRSRPVVVVNATEGEPRSGKDAMLMHHAPHLVLDGALAVARAWHASEVVVALAADAVVPPARLAATYASRGDSSHVPVRVTTVPARYVSGQSAALARALSGGAPLPRPVPPRLTKQGVAGRPTVLSNAETWAHVALIARHGGAWFAGIGEPQDPGTRLLTISGAVTYPGVVEVPSGTSLGQVLAGAGAVPGEAILVGGYAGCWLPWPAAGAIGVSEPQLRSAGGTLGVGAIEVLGPNDCPVEHTLSVLRWKAGQSAGQCGPCIHGVPALAAAMHEIAMGSGSTREVSWLSGLVDGRGACHLPDGAARLARSLLTAVPEHVARHVQGSPCRGLQVGMIS